MAMIRKTSLNLDFALVHETKRVLGTRETTETIHRALADLVRQERFEMSPLELQRLRET